MNEEEFKTTIGFKSYISKPEVTALTPNFLVKGSKNVLIDFAQRVISRNGYSLFAAPAVVDSYTESNWAFSLDFLDSLDAIGVGMNFTASKTGLLDSVAFFLTRVGAPTGNAVAKLYAITGSYGTTSIPTGAALATSDLIDVTTIQQVVDSNNLVQTDYQLIKLVFSGANRYRMLSGVNYVATIEYADGSVGNYISVGGGDSNLPTGNPVQNYGSGWQTYTGDAYNFYVYSGTSIVNGGGIKSSYEWSTSTAKQFSTRVFDQYLEFYWNDTYNQLLSGLTSPNMEFAKVWDDTEKIDVLLMVNGEANMKKWSGGVAKVRSSTATTLTKQGVLTSVTTVAFVAGTTGSVAPTITDSANNFLNAGFAVGDSITVTGSTANSRIFTIGSVVAGTITLIMSDVLVSEAVGATVTLHNGEPTWASSRFLTTGTRKITYLGVDYTYTGGESTAILTGLTAFPTVTVGEVVWQTVQILNNPGDINANFKQDLIGVQLNQVVLGSTKSMEIYGSRTTSYVDFALTSPRAPGDPFKVTMDNYATCILKIDNAAQSTSALMFGGGTSEFFKLNFQMSQDNSNEIVRMIQLKTANGSGLISRGAITAIKNATAYITREPSLDTLGDVENVDGKTNVPLSDLIKDDFDSYDFTGAHVKYWKRAIYITVPVHGLVLIFDLMRKLWQPPQTIPVSRLAVINDLLYGHSSITNETYQLFVGTNDNGNAISQVARFAYNNGGRRDRIKNMNEYWTDGYITPNGELDMTHYFGFNGTDGIRSMTILGNDVDIVSQPDSTPLGDDTLGSNPIGGASSTPTAGLPGSGTILSRFWQLDTIHVLDYVEEFVEYSMDTLDGQFAIVAHGSNQYDAGTTPTSHMK